jgi:hypothetical protein
LKDYTIPFVQLDPLKSILVFSHEHNTYDKRKMLDTAHPDFFKESTKTVATFIREEHEQPITTFFMNDIDDLLEKYEPGLPKMKPDVLEQIKVIEERRDKMIKELEEQQNKPIMLTQPGKPARKLNNNEVVQMINNHQTIISKLTNEKQEMQNTLMILQSEFIKQSMEVEKIKKERDELKQQLLTLTENTSN